MTPLSSLAGWRRFFRRAGQLARKAVAITSRTRPVVVPLEGLFWAEVRDGRIAPPTLAPGVRWRDRTACADEGEPAELLMDAGVEVTYRLNLPAGSALRARCRWTGQDGAAGRGVFSVVARPLNAAGAEVRRDLTLAGGGIMRVDLAALRDQRVELTLRVASVPANAGGTGHWLEPNLTYAVPRPPFARRLRVYLSTAGPGRLRAQLARTFANPHPGTDAAARGSASQRARDPSWLVSVLLAIEGHDPDAAQRAVESVLAQSSGRWELLLAVGSDLPPATRRWLEERTAADERLRFVSADGAGGQAAQLQAALLAARGQFAATLGEGDTLARGAVERVLLHLAQRPDTAWIYTDEERMDARGRRVETRAKPAWGRDSLLSGLLPGRGCVWRRETALAAGGFCVGADGAEEYDLALRLTEREVAPGQLPLALYRTHLPPEATAAAGEAERMAAGAYLARTGTDAQVAAGPDPEYFRTRYRIDGTPLVSIILPTNGVRREIGGRQVDLLATCVSSIVAKSDYPHFEVLCVDNANLQPETLAALDGLGDRRVRVISFTAPFNLADKFNWAVGHAQGDHLLLLNDDTEVITAEWLSAMLEFSQQRRVGAVGAKLFFPSGQLQHAGVPLAGRLPGHRAYGLPEDLERLTPGLRCIRNDSAVTGACLMTRRALYEQVGGFSREFALNYNDVDYCLKVRAAGHDVVFTPFAALWHYESLSREKGVRLEEIERWRKVWSDRVEDDPDERPSVWVRGAAFNWLPD